MRSVAQSVAQSAEQGIENPCVGGSIPPQATSIEASLFFREWGFFVGRIDVIEALGSAVKFGRSSVLCCDDLTPTFEAIQTGRCVADSQRKRAPLALRAPVSESLPKGKHVLSGRDTVR